jgi:hypothetical protein
MTGTPNPACPLCGLRFASRPLLELHIREDHRQRDCGDPDGTQTHPPRTDSQSHRHDLAPTPSRTAKEVTAMTATHRPRPGRIMTGTRRVIHALRYVDDELMRASEAIIRSARVPQPRPQTQATASRDRETAEQVDMVA